MAILLLIKLLLAIPFIMVTIAMKPLTHFRLSLKHGKGTEEFLLAYDNITYTANEDFTVCVFLHDTMRSAKKKRGR